MSADDCFRFETAYEMFFDAAQRYKATPEELKELKMKELAKNLRELFNSLPQKHSGFISEEAALKKQANPKFKPTREHFFSRTRSGRKVIEQILLGKSKDRVIVLIKSRCRYHFTLDGENNKLIQYQHLTPVKAYAMAQIKLVKYVKSNQKYKWIVDGTEWTDKVKLAKHYGITGIDVTSRCKAKKWPTWKQVSI